VGLDEAAGLGVAAGLNEAIVAIRQKSNLTLISAHILTLKQTGWIPLYFASATPQHFK
jgi:hypothetical protein